MRSPFNIFARTPAPAAPFETRRAPLHVEPAAARSAIWPYSGSFADIADEGHQRPPPSFGVPTLVWHVGIWPKAIGGDLDPRTSDPNLALEKRIEIYEDNNRAFFDELSAVLTTLQEHGRVAGTSLRTLKVDRPKLAAKKVHAFEICVPQSLTFTMWWQDAAGRTRPNVSQHSPSPEDLRVRVQAQTHLDHATLSFFIDAAKPWNRGRVVSAKDAPGARRRAIFEHVEAVRAVCSRQIAASHVDLDRIPEAGVGADDARRLLAAANYCYDEIWQELTEAFGLGGLVALDGRTQSNISEVFASFRTLVLASDGLPSPATDQRNAETAALRRKIGLNPAAPAATVGIGPFETFDPNCGEPNTVLKAHWPFIRRMSPGADNRDFVACGVFDWRALFVTSLGSRIENLERDEADNPASIAAGGALPAIDNSPRGLHRPIHQLFLTKGKPHRQQIGRIVERANAVGTMRLYALRNWDTIRNAGIHIRLIGDQLDGILSEWSRQRRDIDKDHPLPVVQEEEDDDDVPAGDYETQKIKDRRIRALNTLIHDTEFKLIQLGADLDTIGQGGSGRLLYAINRAKHFIGEFQRLMTTLNITNVPTWTTYEQFVDRGLAPTFEAIQSTGDRLRSLRDRLQSVTDMVQTGALIVETEATENNTQALKRLAYSSQGVDLGLAVTVFGLFLQLAEKLPARLLSQNAADVVVALLSLLLFALSIALSVRAMRPYWKRRRKRAAARRRAPAK
jgi:hypothetical protein